MTEQASVCMHPAVSNYVANVCFTTLYFIWSLRIQVNESI